MGTYEFLDKTADIRIRIVASDLKDLLITGAEAFLKVMTSSQVETVKKQKITFKADSEEKLLFKFLEELLFLIDTQNFLVSKIADVNIKQLGEGFSCELTVLGDNNLQKYDLSSGIKAITYNDFIYKKEGSRIICEITLDL
jgi:SHS2 domain-containing protein